MKNTIEHLQDLFDSSELVHGANIPTEVRDHRGKLEARSWSVKEPIKESDWKSHLEGKRGLGCNPINGKSMCKWGAIDVDNYKMSLEDLNKKISATPFVLCSSKSGGAHLYCFLTDWIPARTMIKILEAFASHMGFGKSELFPKQEKVDRNDPSKPDLGNWINMPYFGNKNTNRPGYDANGPTDIDTFIKYCMMKRLDATMIDEMILPEPDVDEILDGAPPCIQIIMGFPEYQTARNETLTNVTVFLKMKYPDKWGDYLVKVNEMFAEPLPASEVENLRKSYDKKDYRYKCSKEPLCNHCNATECRTRRYGVTAANGISFNKSLTKLCTDPPIWGFDLEHNNRKVRLHLSTDQLMNQNLFKKACMEALNFTPPRMKDKDWEDQLNGMMMHVTEIDVPRSLTPKGQLAEHLEDFLTTRISKADDTSIDDCLKGLAYQEVHSFYFRQKDFLAYLKNEGFNLLKQNEIVQVLTTELKGSSVRRTAKGKQLRLWEINDSYFTSIKEDLKVPTYETDY